MSNIIKNKEDLLKLKDIINSVRIEQINKHYLDYLMQYFIPNNDGMLLTKYIIQEKGNSTAIFIPSLNRIEFSVNKIHEWLNINASDNKLKNLLEISDEDKFRKYLFLMMLTHEVEHAYQFLMGEGKVVSPNNLIKESYKLIFDLLNPKETILPRPIYDTRRRLSMLLYKIKENNYFIERNAQIESIDLVMQVALFCDDEGIYNGFNKMHNMYLKHGYEDNTYGNVYETYKKILMLDKYNKLPKNVMISDDDKVRFGLEISEDTRQKVLSL